MRRIFHRLVQEYRERLYLNSAADVLATPPISAQDDGVVLFSMIGTRVVLPYLVAVKSLHHWLQAGRIVILDDGTLTDRDKELLAYHCDSPRIIHIGTVDTSPCPVGNIWERLLTLLSIRRDDYVIQLDSDTVTLGPVPEVQEAIKTGRNFTLRGEVGAELLSFVETAALQKGKQSDHVQSTIEARMDELSLPDMETARYVRGCAGFAGFARSADGRGMAERFSVAADALLGREKWSEWGSEQVTSNLVVASSDDPLLLPYDRYMNHWDAPIPDGASFAHFIGTYRYSGGEYTKATRHAIAMLKTKGA